MALVDHTEDARATGYPDQRKIARDSCGRLYVAYRRKYRLDGLLRYHIFVAQSIDNGASWSVLNNGTPIERVGDYTQRNPSIVVDAQDAIHVAWYGTDPQNAADNQRQIKYARSTDYGTTWSWWVNVAEVPGYAGQSMWQEHPVIAVTDDHSLLIAWQGLDATTQASQVKLARSLDGGATWSGWQAVQPHDPGNRSRPTLVATGQAMHLLAYGSVRGMQQIVWTWSLDGGATWAPWSVVAASAADQRHVSAAADTAGRLHAVWRQGDPDGRCRIAYATCADRVWSRPALIGADAGAQQFFPSIAVTGDDAVWVAWTEARGASGYPKDAPADGRVMYTTTSADGAWGACRSVACTDHQQGYATLRWGRYHNSNAADLIWVEQRPDARHRICYQRLG